VGMIILTAGFLKSHWLHLFMIMCPARVENPTVNKWIYCSRTPNMMPN
jgi:hypothetical protein